MSGVDLLRVASPDRIAAYLGHGLSGDLVQRFLDRPPLRRGLVRLLEARFAGAETNDRKRAKAHALDLGGVTDLATQAGIVWHSALIAGVIDATARCELIDRIGEDRYRLALSANRGVCELPATKGDVDTSAIAREGMGCLAAWRASQLPPLADRLRLYWPDVDTTPAQQTFGPGIVDWLLDRPSD